MADSAAYWHERAGHPRFADPLPVGAALVRPAFAHRDSVHPRYNPRMGTDATPRRRKHRLAADLYEEPGAYFVTVCAHERRCTLGTFRDDVLSLTPLGHLARRCWLDLPNHWAGLALDAFVVMPNHVHGIVVFATSIAGRTSAAPTFVAPVAGRTSAAPTEERPLPAPSLPQVMQAYKAAATRLARAEGIVAAQAVWQRGYYDHVIRDEKALQRIREYVLSNPLAWALDRENPQRVDIHPFYAWMEEQTAQLNRRL